MRGAHRLVAWVLAFAMVTAEDVRGQPRAPQRDQRGDQPGPLVSTPATGRQYNHASMHETEAPADIRDARIPKPHAEHPHEGQGSQDGAKADERRHETGHDRDRARRAIARSNPPNIRA